MNTSEKLQALFEAALRGTHDAPGSTAPTLPKPSPSEAQEPVPGSGDTSETAPAMSPAFRSMLEQGMLRSAKG